MTQKNASTSLGQVSWSPDYESRGIHTRPFNGETNDWITPKWLIDALGPFDLDPCASTHQPWPCAARSFTYHDDGLRQPWEGLVWLNPPYGPNVGEWLRKLAAHPAGGVALIAARTETRMFRAEVWGKAEAVLFLASRVTFHRPDGEPGIGNSGHSSILVAYGMEAHGRILNVKGTYIQAWDVIA